MALLNENIRYLRKNKGWTQQELADKIGIKRSLVGAYEEGRAEPSAQKLLKFAEILYVTVDDLIGLNLKEHSPGSPHFKVLAITVDENEKENIELVPQKAAAGYLNGYADPEYIKELPRFKLPFLPSNGSYRAFEITGDSMLPLVSGTVIIGQYVEQLVDSKDGKTYILVTKNEGVVFKRVFNYLKDKGKLFLTSDNMQYTPFEIDPEDVMEVWLAKAYISVEFPDPSDQKSNQDVTKLAAMVMNLQEDVQRLKTRDI